MNIGIVGAGSWGTALAKLAAELGHAVSLWAYEPDVAQDVRERRCNSRYLPSVELPELDVSQDLGAVVAGRDVIISVVPSHVARDVWRRAGAAVTGTPIIVSATKGIEEGTLASMTEVVRDCLPQRLHRQLAVLSGPSFAVEVARAQPTAVVVAAEDDDVARTVQEALGGDAFRVYTSGDMVGVGLGGATKNVVAIAVGMSDGLGFGANARAALITRGLAEIGRLAVAKGANPLTVAGLSGMGDLVLTCTSDLSRNRRVGLRLGRGESLEAIARESSSVAEGVLNAKSCRALAERIGVEMPVVDVVYDVLYEGLNPREAARRLMSREQKGELDDLPDGVR